MTMTECIQPGSKRKINESARSPMEPGLRKGGSDDANSRLISGGTPVPRPGTFGDRRLTEEEVEALFDNMPV